MGSGMCEAYKDSSRKASLQSGHFSRDLEEVMRAIWISGGGVFQADETACTKALGQELGACVP